MHLDTALKQSRLNQAGFYDRRTLYLITYDEKDLFESLLKCEAPKKPGQRHKVKQFTTMQFETKFGVTPYEWLHWKPIAPKPVSVVDNLTTTDCIKCNFPNGNYKVFLYSSNKF